jgi:uncharacterized FAD-dependent dehydrogenase
MIKEIEIAVLPKELENEALIEQKARKKLKLGPKDQLIKLGLKRRSIDARGRQPLFRLLLEAFINESPKEEARILDQLQDVSEAPAVIIVGAGPAGYFAALELIELGLKPIIFERGKDVRARRRDLRAIQQDGIVNPDSNYCFGEGGAGTYSDGKLYTRSKKRGSIEKTLRLLVEHGATSEILIDAHPHIGSNKLPKVVAAIRETILSHGGEIHFDAKVTDFIIRKTNTNRLLEGVVVNEKTEHRAKAVILATGHSARDIFRLLHKHQVKIEAKPFALGVRIEHPQPLIDEIRYNQRERAAELPASSYSLVCQVENRGVFSFCMCPGGLIVPAATAPGELVVNGMSMSRRDSPFANSGMVVAVELEDLKAYQKEGVFAALAFQQAVEKTMFEAGDGGQAAPAQRITDFVKGQLSKDLPKTSYIPGVYSARMDQLLPEGIADRLKVALGEFGRKMKGYFTHEAQIVGTESRTSSPIRIPRDSNTCMHDELIGLFPSGEGAGYAGGIISAAMDGQRVARAIAEFYKS